MADLAFRDKNFHKSTIYSIINKTKAGKITDDQNHLNSKKTKRNLKLVAALAASVKKEAWMTVSNLALAHQVSVSTIIAIFHKELGLVKKSAIGSPNFCRRFRRKRGSGPAATSLLRFAASVWLFLPGFLPWTNPWCPSTLLKIKE